jgi:hypothetical protein
MQQWKVDEAKAAADRFIDAVDAMNLRASSDDYFRRMKSVTGFKETAAVRRASLDLTRALAEMRKP